MKSLCFALPIIAVAIAAPLFAHPAAEDDKRCHMHEDTGTLHCPEREEVKEDAPDPRPMRSQSVFYRNCNAARAAGVAPIRRGDPGYRPELDGDNDGWACEPYRKRR